MSALSETTIKPDPLELFRTWFDDAAKAGIAEPNAMTLATVDKHGQPYARIVLLKDVTPEGFTFFTNYNSTKARNIAENPHVSLLFFWAASDRQVRIRGSAEKVPPDVSQAYFATRPRESRIGAWVSPQSDTIPNRDYLEKGFAEVAARYEGKDIPCPPHWGGYLVKPAAIEFWQRGDHRLHDRFLYEKQAEGWSIRRIAP